METAMARKFKVAYFDYLMHKLSDEKFMVTDGIGAVIGFVSVAAITGEKKLWSPVGTTKWFDTPLAASKAMVGLHRSRWTDVDRAHDTALSENEARNLRALSRMMWEARCEDAAFMEAKRRRECVMLTPLYNTDGSPRGVEIFGSGRADVTIYVSQKDYRDKKCTAEVNWSAWGSTDANRTREYARAISFAADLAEAWNLEQKSEPVEV
jgi:hypothetical protein